MGTPDFAKESLENLYDAGYEVCGVVTTPDRPAGRGMKMVASPVKEYAISKNLKVFQPEKITNNTEFKSEIKKLNPDLVCVVSYGVILPKSFLKIPKYGCINVHPSMLPKYRGSAPIQWAILNGDKTTGVTIMYLNEQMDAGDIILQTKQDGTYEITQIQIQALEKKEVKIQAMPVSKGEENMLKELLAEEYGLAKDQIIIERKER